MQIHASKRVMSLTSLAVLAAWCALLVVPVAPAWSADGPPPPMPKPTEAQMGAPVYPGATYDGQMSAALSQDDFHYWVFSTPDPVAKVAGFYKQKTGLVPLEIGGNYQFTIKKGDNPYFPDRGITIEPDKMFVGGKKTAITFISKK